MSHVWTSHVTRMNESCRTYEWVMSHVWTSHVPHMNESCRTYEWVMSHVWTSHVPHMNESCPTYEWVMSHIWMSHVTHMNESCHILIHPISHDALRMTTIALWNIMISRLLLNIGLFWKIQSLLQGSFAKETYMFREPTHRSHLIAPWNIWDSDWTCEISLNIQVSFCKRAL